METVGYRISETRKGKGLTQEELAEQAQLSLRTVQRIENSESEPRGKTLSLLCNALNLNVEEFQGNETNTLEKKKVSWHKILLDLLFLLLLNIFLMAVFGYLLLDTSANLNSKSGAYLLAIFIPLTILAKTPGMDAVKRILCFGSGLLIYCLLFVVLHGIPQAFVSGLLPCLVLAITVLYFGEKIMAEKTG